MHNDVSATLAPALGIARQRSSGRGAPGHPDRRDTGPPILAVRNPADTDGRLWPRAAARPTGMLVEREELDGGELLALPVSLIMVCEVTPAGLQAACGPLPVAGWLYLTAARTVVAYQGYGKRRRWRRPRAGGLVYREPGPHRSAMSPRHRRRPTPPMSLVAGQVRHQWLMSVGARSLSSEAPQEKLRLGFATRTDTEGWRYYALQVTIGPDGGSAMAAGRQIARGAAAFKLDWYGRGLPGEARVQLEQMAAGAALGGAPPGPCATYLFPHYLAVKAGTAAPTRYAVPRQVQAGEFLGAATLSEG